MAETICWYCDKAAKCECSWDKDLIPVEGWVAIPVTVPVGSERIPERSFVVQKCPEYRAPEYLAAAGRVDPPTEREMTYWAYRGFSRSEITEFCRRRSEKEKEGVMP